MPDQNPHPFEALTPDFVMDAVESRGYLCDCRTFALNSYENRVYQVGIEDGEPLIVKFYRPDRWTDAQIMEEHQFCFELVAHELPVVAPLSAGGESLHSFRGFRFAIFPRRGGHAPELDDLDNLFILGRLLGRIHRVGTSRPFRHRPRVDPAGFGHRSVDLVSERFIPAEYRPVYDDLTAELLRTIENIYTDLDDLNYIRVHGDCHTGNLLWRKGAPHFVDFDDARNAPAVQDLWMLLSGDRQRQSVQFARILEGYSLFHDFALRELRLVEVLRTLRMLYYTAWLGSRWDDPAFPANFPWFNTMPFWGEHILQLREQLAAMHEPPLQIPV